MGKKKTQSLFDWINETGVKKVAKLLKVHPTSVTTWARGTNIPRAHLMHKIHRLSKGRVTYQEMIDTHVAKHYL